MYILFKCFTFRLCLLTSFSRYFVQHTQDFSCLLAAPLLLPPPTQQRRCQTYGAWAFFKYSCYLCASVHVFVCVSFLHYVINNLVLAFNRSSIHSRQTWRMLDDFQSRAFFFKGHRKCKSCPKTVAPSPRVCVRARGSFPRFAWKPSALISANNTHTHTDSQWQPDRLSFYLSQRESNCKSVSCREASAGKRERMKGTAGMCTH